MLLPIVMEELREFYRPHAARLAGAFGIDACGQTPEVLLDRVIARIRDLQMAIGMPRDFDGVAAVPVDPALVVRAILTDPLAALYRISAERATAIVARALGVDTAMHTIILEVET